MLLTPDHPNLPLQLLVSVNTSINKMAETMVVVGVVMVMVVVMMMMLVVMVVIVVVSVSMSVYKVRGGGRWGGGRSWSC